MIDRHVPLGLSDDFNEKFNVNGETAAIQNRSILLIY